ncbi:MAG: hypothetical protein IJ175_03800 [Clostridia bacterium]|nr:hypothetical protein [Clostridia bacterium]
MTLIRPVLFFLILNSGVVALFRGKARFGSCLPITMIASVLILMAGQIVFYSFQQAYGLLLALACLSIPSFVWLFRKSRNAIVSSGFWMFLVICFVFAAVDWNRKFSEIDEWYHWGMMVKECMRTDHFYSDPASNLFLHKDYPPFACLFEMLWCRLGGGYSEQNTTIALHVFSFSMLLPWFVETLDFCAEKRKVLKSLSLLVISLAVILAFEPGHMLVSILLDVPLPILFTASFMLVYTNTVFKQWVSAVSYVLIQTAMVLSKQVGWAFLMVAAVFCLMKSFALRKQVEEKRKYLMKCVILNASGCFFPGLLYLGWSRYIKGLNLYGQFGLYKVQINDYLAAVTGKQDYLRADTLRRYSRALFQVDIARLPSLPLSYITACCLALVIVYIFYKKFGCRDRENFIPLTISFFCGSAGYAFMMSVLYLFCFSGEEMRRLASYQRYMASYIVGEMLILVLVFVYQEVKSGKNHLRTAMQWIISASIVLVVLGNTNCYYLMPRILWDEPNGLYKDYAKTLADSVPSGSSVFIIDDIKKNKSVGQSTMKYYVGYYDNDLKISHDFNEAYDCDITIPRQIEVMKMSICVNDYLYLIDKPVWMDTVFEGQLKGAKAFEANTVYQIQRIDNVSFYLYPVN